MIRSDQEMLWRPARIYIPAWQFSGLDYEATTATDIKSIGTGAANDTAIVEINTSGVTAINMTAAANSVDHLMIVPADMDISKNIYFRVYWTANNTSGTTTWAVAYKKYVAGTTVLGTAVAATALDKVILVQTMAATAYTIMQTGEGILKPAVTPIAENVELLQLDVALEALATITTASFLGLEIRYTPKRMWGPDGMLAEAKPKTYIASKMEPN